MTEAIGVVLAAGAGRRMGMPKALLRDDHGRPLLDRAVSALLDGGCRRVVVVLGARAHEVPAVGDDRVTTVIAPDWADGMGASLRAALTTCARLASTGPALAVITLVDLPDVDARVVHRVVTQADPLGASALARAVFDGRPGHPVVIGRAHWAAARSAATGDRGARDLFAEPHREVECSDLATGADVDTPADLRRVTDLPRMSEQTRA